MQNPTARLDYDPQIKVPACNNGKSHVVSISPDGTWDPWTGSHGSERYILYLSGGGDESRYSCCNNTP